MDIRSLPTSLSLSPPLCIPTCVVTQKRAFDERSLSSSIPPCSSRVLPRHRWSRGQWFKQSRLHLMSAEALPPISLLLSWFLSLHTQSYLTSANLPSHAPSPSVIPQNKSPSLGWAGVRTWSSCSHGVLVYLAIILLWLKELQLLEN